MKFCTNCGKEIPENAKFCPDCGAATEENTAGGDSAVTLAGGETGGKALPLETVPNASTNPATNPSWSSMSFSGRATRGQWFAASVVAGILIGVILALDFLVAPMMVDGAGIIIAINLIFGIPLTIWALATQVRRLHDIGWSGLCVLLPLIPFAGWIAGMVLWVVELFMDGQPGPNRYGPDPKGRPSPYAGGTVTGTIRFSTQG